MRKEKKHILITMTAAALMMFSLSGLMGQASRGSGNIRKIDSDSFIFLELQDPLLYGETDYTVNPGVLQRLDSRLLRTDLSTIMERNLEISSRLDDTFGSIGGSYTNLGMLLQPGLHAAFITPIGEGTKVPVFGVAGDFSLTYDSAVEEHVNYNAFSESIQNETEDLYWTAGSDLYLALDSKSNLIGFSLGYDYAYIPKLYGLITDSTLSDGVYVDEEIRNYDETAHSIGAKAGLVLPLSRAAELSLALNYTGDFSDKSVKYIARDGNDDGYMETVQSYDEYHANNGSFYDSKDLTIGTNLTFHPLIRLYVSDAVELFITGEYTILGRSDRTYYQRVRHISDLTDDQSWARETYDTSFTSFAALMGLAVETDDNGLFKFGVSYTREDQRFSQEGVGPAGVNFYSRLNTNKFTELNLGLEPLNNSIISILENPTEELNQILALKLGYEHFSGTGLSTYFLIQVTGTDYRKTYHAYNLDTRSVWYEEENGMGLAWEIEPVAGIAIKVGKKKDGIWSINLKGTGSSGDAGIDGESAPFDTFIGRTSTNGEIDAASSSWVNFEVSTGFQFLF